MLTTLSESRPAYSTVLKRERSIQHSTVEKVDNPVRVTICLLYRVEGRVDLPAWPQCPFSISDHSLAVGSRLCSNLINSQSLEIERNCIPFKRRVKTLAVYLDNTLSMHHHISHLCRSLFLALRRIASIRSYLTESNNDQLVFSFITCRLDYCNYALADLSAIEINRSQRVQNNAARLVLKKSKRDHVSPLLLHLHWLPIPARIDYKIATFAYRHFEVSLQAHLSSALDQHLPSFSLSQIE